MRKLENSAKYSISIPADVIEDLKARKLVISEVIRNALQLSKLEPSFLYEVSMAKEDSLFYCIVDKCSEVSVLKEMNRLDYFLMGFKVNGNGAYKIRLVGAFPDMSDARLYSEFLINKALDKGHYMVNDFFQRYISLRLELSRISAVIPSDVDLSILVSEVIGIIESSNRTTFNDKLNDSLDSITSLVNKRIRI